VLGRTSGAKGDGAPVIRLETSLGGHDEVPHPRLVWAQLIGNAANGWGYAEIFRRALRMPTDVLLPSAVRDHVEQAGAVSAETQRMALEAVHELMREWRSRQPPRSPTA
jgi:hypothetical protein